jgi:type IV secretion system protein VirB1
MLEFLALAQECAPMVAPQTMAAVVSVESGYNPNAIGVVGGRLARQPKSRDEAIATARQLEKDGWNFSLGVAQINRHNLPKYQITYEQAFDVCTNLRIGAQILEECYVRAVKRTPEPQAALQAAFSCYYSGNFTRGFKPDVADKPSYVQKVLARAETIPVVPSIQTGSGPKPQVDKAAAPAPKPKKTVKSPTDHAPVLLRPSNAGSKQQPLATESAVVHSNGGTTGANTPTHPSAIVF